MCCRDGCTNTHTAGRSNQLQFHNLAVHAPLARFKGLMPSRSARVRNPAAINFCLSCGGSGRDRTSCRGMCDMLICYRYVFLSLELTPIQCSSLMAYGSPSKHARSENSGRKCFRIQVSKRRAKLCKGSGKDNPSHFALDRDPYHGSPDYHGTVMSNLAGFARYAISV